MIRFHTSSRTGCFGCLATLFALLLLVVLLPLWLLARLFAPRPSMRDGAAPPEEPPGPAPGDDIPASEAVIDVTARAVEESEEPSDNNRIGG